MSKLQQEDEFCKNILSQIEKGNLIEGQLYLMKNNILKRYVIDGDDTYETIMIPRTLTPQILHRLMMNWDTMELTEHIFCLRDFTIGKG